MTPRELALNLGTSVTLADWSRETIEAGLRRRLPGALQRLAPEISGAMIQEFPGRYAPSPKRAARAMQLLPAFRSIFRYCTRHSRWPLPELSSPRMAPVAGFEALDLPPLANLRSLADWLMVTSQQLSYVADLHHRYEAHDDMAVNHYHYHIHRKKGGGLRLVEAPKQGLKAIQRQILRGILDNIPTHPDAFGFVKGRNCVEAAMRHTGEVAVLRFDLKDFFPSIQIMRVFGLFRCLGYPHEVSHNLTALCTTATPPRVLARLDASDRMIYRTAHLPQGAPTSPALANLVSHGLDRRLTGLAGKLDARYSRYADDLSFSGDARIIRPLMKWLPKITAEEGFHLNLEKTRIMAHGSRKMVTGVTVNQHVNVNRFTFDRLKAVIHACGNPEDTRFSDGSFVTSLLGQIGWVEQVNPVRGQKLRRLLAKSWERRFGR